MPQGQCPDSVNVLAALVGESARGRETFVAHNGGTRGPFALRSGTWKYITPSEADGRTSRNAPPANAAKRTPPTPQLFDLATDPVEKRNLADAQPEKLKDMQALLESIQSAP